MKIIECPRDAMQGLSGFIPTEKKIQYIKKLLEVGFDTLDFGSFVSPKAIPQMRDTAEVITQLDVSKTATSLLAIVANTRGAAEASAFEPIKFIGFPLSISETFQVRNTNKTIADALNELEKIKDVCERSDKKLVTYISMAFGNPYGDPYEPAMVGQFIEILIALGTDVISLADTVGTASSEDVGRLVGSVSVQFPAVEVGVHLHSSPDSAEAKLKAAFENGCRRFDGAIKGYGGCPMANDVLVGNMATEKILSFLESRNACPSYNREAFREAMSLASEIFPNH